MVLKKDNLSLNSELTRTQKDACRTTQFRFEGKSSKSLAKKEAKVIMEDNSIVIKVYPTFIKSLSFNLHKIVNGKVYQKNDLSFINLNHLFIIGNYISIFKTYKNINYKLVIRMKYVCDTCNYQTLDAFNFERHKRSSKHRENDMKLLKNEITCPNCDRSFSTVSNLSRHKKSCNKEFIQILRSNYESQLREIKLNFEKNILELQTEIIILKKNNEKLEESNDNLNKIINILTTENDYHKDLVNNAGSIVKTSVNALSYVVKNFNEAPVIQLFSNFELLNTEEKYTVQEVVIFYHKNNNVGKFFGDIIVEIYKKDNPEEQSFWNTDTSRFAYIVREIINDKAQWAIDKGGVKVNEYIVQPILEYIKKRMNEYIKVLAKRLEDPNADILKIQENLNDANAVIVDIDNKVVASEIFKYMTPFFYLNKLKAIKN